MTFLVIVKISRRHESIDAAYLYKTYSKIAKQLTRDNCNIIVLSTIQDKINLRNLFNEHVSPHMPYTHFKKLCADCWKIPFGFLVIPKEINLIDGRYGYWTQGFDKYIKLQT